MLRTPRRLVALAVPLLVLAAACGDDDSDTAATAPLSGGITVLAASSLTEAFEEIALAFEIEHVGTDVFVTFDGSAALATQIEEGVPGDVFAAADEENLARVLDADLGRGAAVRFATNHLHIAVPKGNPADVTSLADLAAGDLRLALCAPEVPCGRYAAETFDRAGLALPEASEEDSVRGVLTKVALGEADAGLVYATDVLTNPDVEVIDLPADLRVVAVYPAAVLRDAVNLDVAESFLRFLLGPQAQAILERHGFGPPP